MLVLAQTHSLSDLESKALTFILHNLTEVLHCQEFSHISKDLLVKIISSDSLSVESESVVLEAIFAWVKGDERKRNTMVPDLLQHVRLRGSDVDTLKNKNNDDVNDADLYLLGPLLHGLTLTESPLPARLTEVVVAVSRETRRKHRGKINDLSNIYYYHPDHPRWEKLTKVPFADRQDFSAVVVENVLYLSGGQEVDVHDIYSTRIIYNEHWAYSPGRDAWVERQAMPVPR